jgi:hypothetical protein
MGLPQPAGSLAAQHQQQPSGVGRRRPQPTRNGQAVGLMRRGPPV